MNIWTLNICLILAWAMITAGAAQFGLGMGLLIGGLTLAIFVLYLSHRYGVYAKSE